MGDNNNNTVNLPNNFIKAENPISSNFNFDMINNFHHNIPNINKQVEENLKHLIPFDEKIKPITERQDRTINALREQIDVYKVENQILQDELSKANSMIQEEISKRKLAEIKRAEAEEKLGKKDWKSFLWSGLIGALLAEVVNLLSKVLFG